MVFTLVPFECHIQIPSTQELSVSCQVEGSKGKETAPFVFVLLPAPKRAPWISARVSDTLAQGLWAVAVRPIAPGSPIAGCVVVVF